LEDLSHVEDLLVAVEAVEVVEAVEAEVAKYHMKFSL
jgi:hypothetical protein